MVNLIILFDNLNQKPAIEETNKKRIRNPTFIGFTRVMQLDMILGKSPARFNGGLLLVRYVEYCLFSACYVYFIWYAIGNNKQ